MGTQWTQQNSWVDDLGFVCLFKVLGNSYLKKKTYSSHMVFFLIVIKTMVKFVKKKKKHLIENKQKCCFFSWFFSSHQLVDWLSWHNFTSALHDGTTKRNAGLIRTEIALMMSNPIWKVRSQLGFTCFTCFTSHLSISQSKSATTKSKMWTSHTAIHEDGTGTSRHWKTQTKILEKTKKL